MFKLFCIVAIIIFFLDLFVTIAYPFYEKYGKFKFLFHDILAFCIPGEDSDKCKYCGKEL